MIFGAFWPEWWKITQNLEIVGIKVDKVLFNKFIDHLFPLMHVQRSRFSMSYKLICMLSWISMYVLIGSHKFRGKFFDFNWAKISYIEEDVDLVCFLTLFKTFQRHSPSTFHLKDPLWIFKENQHFSPPLPPSKSTLLPGYFVHSFDFV